MANQFTLGRTDFVVQQRAPTLTPGERLRLGVMNADNMSQMAYQQQWIDRMIQAIAKPNTKLAYEPKQTEFLEFCDEMYGTEQVPRHVKFEKVYKFLFYVSHRSKRKRGKKTGERNGNAYFNVAEFDEVWNFRRGTTTLSRSEPVENAPHRLFEELPTDAPGWNVFLQYRAAIKKLHDNNLKNKLTGESWSQDIWTPWCRGAPP